MNKLRNTLNKVIEVICITLLAFMVVLGTCLANNNSLCFK